MLQVNSKRTNFDYSTRPSQEDELSYTGNDDESREEHEEPNGVELDDEQVHDLVKSVAKKTGATSEYKTNSADYSGTKRVGSSDLSDEGDEKDNNNDDDDDYGDEEEDDNGDDDDADDDDAEDREQQQQKDGQWTNEPDELWAPPFGGARQVSKANGGWRQERRLRMDWLNESDVKTDGGLAAQVASSVLPPVKSEPGDIRTRVNPERHRRKLRKRRKYKRLQDEQQQQQQQQLLTPKVNSGWQTKLTGDNLGLTTKAKRPQIERRLFGLVRENERLVELRPKLRVLNGVEICDILLVPASGNEIPGDSELPEQKDSKRRKKNKQQQQQLGATLPKSDQGDVLASTLPFVVSWIDRVSGEANLEAKHEELVNCELQQNYTFKLRAIGCDGLESEE